MAIDRQESPYRRGNRYDRLPIPMITEHCIPVDAGAVQLVVESRVLTNEIIQDTFAGAVAADVAFDDFGATLHVCGSADGLEHLRFDCFENEPHYHYIDQGWPSATPSSSRSRASSTTFRTCSATAASVIWPTRSSANPNGWARRWPRSAR